MYNIKIILYTLLACLLLITGAFITIVNLEISSISEEYYFHNLRDKLIQYKEYNHQSYSSYESYIDYLQNQSNLNNEDFFAISNAGEIDLTDSLLYLVKIGSHDNLSLRVCYSILGKYSSGYRMPVLDIRDVESLQISKLEKRTTQIYSWSDGFFITDPNTQIKIEGLISQQLRAHYFNVGLLNDKHVGLDTSIMIGSEYIRIEYNKKAKFKTQVLQAFSNNPIEAVNSLSFIAKIIEEIENQECLKSVDKCVIYLNVVTALQNT